MARKKIRFDGHDLELTPAPKPAGEGGDFVGPPAPPTGKEFDLLMAAAPVSPSAPSNGASSAEPPLEDRLRRVEEALTRLAEMQGGRPDKGNQMTTQPSLAPTVLAQAVSLVEAGRQLLPAVSVDARDAPKGKPGTPVSHLDLLRDTIAELRAIYYMSVDPRYRLTWFGRVVPLALFCMVLTSSFWLPLVGCGIGAFFRPIVDLVLCYVLFKILSVEARRYRETAPDLPPSLRL